MTARQLADYVASEEPVLKLPQPYLTPYYVRHADASGFYKLKAGENTSHGPVTLTESSVVFSEPEDLKSGDRPEESNNTAWARARRSPLVTVQWEKDQERLLPAVWLVIYVILTIRPGEEVFRIRINGPQSDTLVKQLKTVALAVDHPRPSKSGHGSNAIDYSEELLVLRGSFWQGAGSPFGRRPIWVPEDTGVRPEHRISSYPLTPLEYTMTVDPPSSLCWHPRRPVKPRPSSVIYSRYIPHLKEDFSMVALDHEDQEHVQLFHQWQNDPRVSQGWNQTGTLDQHRDYLRKVHEDPHQLAILARFDGTYFAYFEVYWAKEDRLGGYYSPGDFDRGRYSLVGDIRFRGPHRVSAWWSSLMHYLFLDDPRTMQVVGEPKYTNSAVLVYDLMHGFGLDKFVDLPDKRSAFMRCSRERFFQFCPLDDNPKFMGGTSVGLVPRL
ncbi:acyl-CoA N-acyltransferase [Coniochaeta sp. 2T2.1]|nr:acyl-CoA N-acyltransferase [Coniochaeta sp. 2T2.1]